MSEQPNVVDVTLETFEREVVQKSLEVPVLVDFWAEWCGPCKMQLPILLKLAEEYQGQFVLAKVDTEDQQELAAHFGIRSIPTMKLVHQGQIVEDITGAQPEAALREILERYVSTRPSNDLRKQALEKAESDPEEALAMLRMAAADDPDNTQIHVDYARICLAQGHYDDVEQTLNGLPLNVREDNEVKQLLAAAAFAKKTGSTGDASSLQKTIEADPNNLATREQLANLLAAQGNAEGAMEQFLEILKRDKSFNDEIGKRGLLQIFEMLGNEGELVAKYRRKMFGYLY